MIRTLLDPDSVARGLRRLAGEIVERHAGAHDLVLVGVRKGGIAIARELLRWVRELEHRDVPFGTVDITLYRDDASTALPNPRIGPSEIPVSLDGQLVVLVDDVLCTGRTARAAIDALMDYGRPRVIELAVLIDRGGRELPIQADYVVKRVEFVPTERVDVVDQGSGLRAIAQPPGSIIPPGPPSG
jgi:pyrimidine operon attenuation protein / uracil phosphoribosyltransferase